MKALVMESRHAPLIVCRRRRYRQGRGDRARCQIRNSGQDCLAPIIYVQRPIYETILRGFARRIESLRTGNGLSSDAISAR